MADKADFRNDLYTAVNGEWQKQAVIPDDKPTTGGFTDLGDGVEKNLMADFAEVADGGKAPDKYFAQAVELYKIAKDFKHRDEYGVAPELKRLHQINELTDVDEFNHQAGELNLDSFPLPFRTSVEPDMADTRKNAVYIQGPSTILPDTTYYNGDNPSAHKLLTIYRQTAASVLAATDLDEATQKDMIDRTLKFDAAIAKIVKSNEEWADYPASYNPMPLTDVAAKMDPFDLITFLNDTMPALPEQIVVSDPRFLDEMSKLFNADTFADYRAWAYVNDLLRNSGYLSEELRVNGGAYNRALSGAPTAISQVKHAYRLANSFFSEPIGVYYGVTYFGEDAKADVIKMVKRMITTYKERIQKSSWLSPETSAKAVVKLDKMVIKMGYPDKVEAVYDEMNVDPHGNLLNNVIRLNRIARQDQYGKLIKPVDRTEWAMPGNLVNACYDPSHNDITFPAAILQAPFYSLEQSDSENLGGIGAVIAHEISHGFDNNGAKFDELGNLKNWWQDSDYATFNKLTQDMIDEFNGIDYAGGKVNGKLIVSENIADAGGLAAALATAKKEPDCNLVEFFTNWGRIWRQKARPEYSQLLLAVDVHAPNYLRANIQPRNLDDWYTTFNVQPGDGMYLAPEKRITIW
ncbi:M13 family metallopeptidase [Lacticaseibacillus zhaodongensis]|uniref:M13 family metallopeptidase n=1 Tax=Lacticaseibacillus zhaodongensis TaxID=2668065 RepID=UPI0012D2FD50|nr:M13-type metalloendopeptidase [Lacticaseibacillus zhaodongensis]